MAQDNLLKKGLGSAGHIARYNLEKMGELIDKLNAKSEKTHKYQAVNLDDMTAQHQKEDLFREQTIKASSQLLGARFARYGKYAKKVVPDSVFQQVIDGAFMQLAKLAAAWSQMDLPNESRFAGVETMDNEQRYALATDIANQNRALATLGGVSGLAGLAGMLADALWLLLVSLRTIYQLAAVYDQPLTGKQGVKMAYDLLANADLSKMQEKQALLAGLGVSKELLDKADNEGLRRELRNFGVNNQNVTYYAEQVDKLAEQLNINIDHINLSWLTKLLPISSAMVGMYYNSQLIDEVIGVVQATFAPAPKLANRLIANQSDSPKPSQPSAEDSTKDSLKKDMADSDENTQPTEHHDTQTEHKHSDNQQQTLSDDDK